MNRRTFLAGTAAGAANGLAVADDSAPVRWRWPDEAEPHRRTWMAFGASRELWGADLPDVRRALARVARAIVAFEPVTMLVRRGERAVAERLCGAKVQYVETELDDFWIRDSGPVFVRDERGRLGAVDLNFNGWGRKQAHRRDRHVASTVTGHAKAVRVATKLVAEGGGIEVDGRGTAIATESCLLNRNRNPGVTKRDAEAMLRTAFGITRVVWIPGIRGADITDGHTDFYARFARPGVVVAHLEPDRALPDYRLTREHIRILQAARDANGKPLEVLNLPGPTRVRPLWESEEFAAGYVNWYVVNGGVIVPQFGDAAADAACTRMLGRLYPKRRIVSLDIDPIAAGGGGIHCTTQQEPAPPAG